jgi:Glycosyltransferase
MRVAFDLTLATRKTEITGIERYGINLFEAFRKICPDSVAYVTSPDFFSSAENLVLCEQPLKSWLWLPKRMSASKFDAAVFPSMPASPLSLFWKLPSFRIIHDDFPWSRTAEIPLKGRLLFKDVEQLVSPRYQAILTPTRYAADKLSPVFPSHKLSAIGNAPALRFDGGADEISELRGRSFVLSVGTVEPRKNYEKVIEVAAALKAQNVLSIIVGRSGWGDVPEKLKLKSEDPSSNIRWRRDTTDDQLRWLYSNCRSFLTLSHDEGFNMPLVEAGSYGCHVVASDISIHRAVAPPWSQFTSGQADAGEIAKRLLSGTRVADQDYLSYRSRYSWNKIAEDLREKISRILELED